MHADSDNDDRLLFLPIRVEDTRLWLSRLSQRKSVSGNKKPIPIIHPDRCQQFTGRTEFRPGCGGWKCKGGCTLGLPAVPGVACQTCDRYEPDPDYAGRGVAGWVS